MLVYRRVDITIVQHGAPKIPEKVAEVYLILWFMVDIT